MHVHPTETLADLLLELFGPGELRQWIHREFGPAAHDALPGSGASPAELAFAAEQLVRRRGELGPELAAALIDERPRREALIREVIERLAAARSETPAHAGVSRRWRRRSWFAAPATIAVAAAVVLAVPAIRGWFFGVKPTTEFGLWHIEARLEANVVPPSQPLRLEVRSDAPGYVWIFSPADHLPNLVFPCSQVEPDCDAVIAAGGHAIAGHTWRAVPRADTDTFGVVSGLDPGPETLIVLVTANNDYGNAVTHLRDMRPDLDIKPEAVRIGGWGAVVVSYQIAEHVAPDGSARR